MRLLSPLLFALLACFSLVGARTNWFANGFGIREINMLEDDWNHLRWWIQMEHTQDDRQLAMTELRLWWTVAEKSGELPEIGGDASIERARLTPQVESLMTRFQSMLAAGQLDELPITGSGAHLRQLAKLELQLDDLSNERVEHLLTWTQNLQRGVSPVGKSIGIDIGILALQRCKSDIELEPWKQPLPPPR